MLKVWMVLSLIGGICQCLPIDYSDVRLFSYVNNRGPNNYHFSYSTSDGASRDEMGYFLNDIWTVEGSVTTFDNFGRSRTTYYTSNDRGYRTGDVPEVKRTYLVGISLAAAKSLAGGG